MTGAMAQGAAQAWGHAKFSVINDDQRLAGLSLPELMVRESERYIYIYIERERERERDGGKE